MASDLPQAAAPDEVKSDVPTLVSYGYRNIKPAEKRRRVDQHFNDIAWRYDRADALLSFGLHFFWRRMAVRNLRLQSHHRVLDLCGGTGDFAFILEKKIRPAGMIVVCDLNRTMMSVGRSRASHSFQENTISWVQADGERLGFSDASFDIVTVGFGIRNLVDADSALAEIYRVLKPKGRLLIMEFSVPQGRRLQAAHHFYFCRIMPLLGKWVTGSKEPFTYLAESVKVFSSPIELKTRIEKAGFVGVSVRSLTWGVVTIYHADKK